MILRSRASQALPACQSLACKAQRTGQERLLRLRQAASRRSTMTGARCTTMLALWLSVSLLLLRVSDLSMAPSVEFAAFFSASSALMLPCKTSDLRRAGRNPRFGQSARSTLAPGTEASMTCSSSSSQLASASGEGHGPDTAAAGVLLMGQHPVQRSVVHAGHLSAQQRSLHAKRHCRGHAHRFIAPPRSPWQGLARA